MPLFVLFFCCCCWQVGDGTTSVVVLAGELLKNIKGFVEDGVHPQLIIKGFKKASQLCMEKIDEIAVKVDRKEDE